MRAAALLARARSAGLVVNLDDGRLAVSGTGDPPPDLMIQLRTHKASIVEHLTAGHMPRGYGRCPGCREFTMLPAGPEDGVCDACDLAADPAEITLRGEAP